MKRILKRLLLFYGIFVLAKIILSSFVFSPTLFADEYYYAKMARSFFYYGKFIVNSKPSWQYHPLYPTLISISYIFSNIKITYFLMKILNAFISSLIIFPAFLITKEFLSKEKAFLSSILVSILPPIFVFSCYIMAENLFFPLFLFTIFLIYKSFTEKSYKWDIFAGLIFGLLYLTKIISVFLIPPILTVLVIQLIKEKNFRYLYKKIILFSTSFLVVLPWLIRNALIFGFSIKGIIGSGYGDNEIVSPGNLILVTSSLKSFFGWLALDITYVALAIGVLFFISSFVLFKTNRKKLFMFYLISIVTSLCFIIFVSWCNIPDGRPMGRYLATIFPLLIILGSISLRKLSKISFKVILAITIPLSLLFAYSTKLINYQLFPANNISLSYIGVLNFILNYLIKDYRFIVMIFIFTLIPFSSLFLYKLKFKKIFAIFLVFFLLINIITYSLVYYNSYTRWYKVDDMQLGLWFNSYDNFKTILFDERDISTGFDLYEEIKIKDRFNYILEEAIGSITNMGFWMNDNIRIGNVKDLENVDYVVSKHKLDLKLIKESDSGIYIYKVR